MAVRKYKTGGRVSDAAPDEATATSVPAPAVVEPEASVLQQQLAHLQAAEQAVREQMARQQSAHPEALATLTPEQHIAAIPGLSEHKRDFLRVHPDLLEPAKAKAANLYYQQALARGVPDDTAQMDQEILRGMRDEIDLEKISRAFSAAPEQPPASPTRRGPPVSAPVSRDAPSMSSGRPQRRIELSPAERDAARFSGISDQEYAANKLRLLQAKAEGRYNEPN